MKKALGYARMSTLEQDSSIERQERDLQEWCAKDSVVLTLHTDHGITAHGKKRKDRPGWKRLYGYITSGAAKADGFTQLRVWKFDRVFRNLEDKLVGLRCIEEAGIEVLSLRDPEPADPMSRLALRVVGGMVDQMYSQNVATHVYGGMRNQASKGRWVYGHAPYGYVVRDGVLVIDEEHPERIRAVLLVFELCLAGDGCRTIALNLTRRGILPPCRDDMEDRRVRAAHIWDAKHVRRIISNRVYVGDLVFDGKVACSGAHPPIIDLVTFERAQRALAGRRRTRRTGNPVRQGKPSLFTPWARCGTCGGPMRIQPGGSRNKPHDYLMCTRRIENRDSCRGINVRTDVLDPKLLSAIQEAVLTPDGVRAMIAASIERLAASGEDELLARRREVEARIAAADAAIRRLGGLVARNVMKEEDAVPDMLHFGEVRDAARDELSDLPLPSPIPTLDQVDIEAFRRAVLAAWTAGTVEEKRRALAQLIERVELHPGEAVIHYRWGGLDAKNQGQSPFGPPWGSSGQYEVRLLAPGLSPPRARPRRVAE